MAKLKLTGVPGTDTESEFILRVDNVIINHTALTRAKFYLVEQTVSLDSQEFPNAWDFSNTGKLIVKLGKGDLTTGIYKGRLIVYDSAHLDGLAWDTDLEITIL